MTIRVSVSWCPARDLGVQADLIIAALGVGALKAIWVRSICYEICYVPQFSLADF